MRKFALAACLAVGLVLAGTGASEAKAQHGFHRAGCNPGYYGGYRGVHPAGVVRYGGYYANPYTPAFYPVGVYSVSRIGVVPYGYGYNNLNAARFGGGFGNAGYYGGGFGNLGYPNTIGPRAMLRIGF